MAEGENIEVGPFMFEPEWSDTDRPNDSSTSESSDDDDCPDERKGRKLLPVIDWCDCENCQTMTTDKECFCCQEWQQINDKLQNIKTAFLNIQIYQCSVLAQLCWKWLMSATC